MQGEKMVSSVSCLSVCLWSTAKRETSPHSSWLPHVLSGQRENMADATFTSHSRRRGGSEAFHCSCSNPCHVRWQYFPTLTHVLATLNSRHQSWSALIFAGVKGMQKCVRADARSVTTHPSPSVRCSRNLKGTTKTHSTAESSLTLHAAF